MKTLGMRRQASFVAVDGTMSAASWMNDGDMG